MQICVRRWQRLRDCERSLPAAAAADRATSVAVTECSYGHAERVQAEVWLGGRQYGHLSAGWRGLLA